MKKSGRPSQQATVSVPDTAKKEVFKGYSSISEAPPLTEGSNTIVQDLVTDTEPAISSSGCKPAKCGGFGPPIRFPFLLKGRQPEHCGYPAKKTGRRANHPNVVRR
ncbi:unnamed protein product [Fraxinus pennsylvanica]|uniref:Uncharacterized protein n=1 Tax=Fraxinus pennsylvanica TaxID=56036 RepID=A0AAD2E4G5_9LAMI|nr:unnamed protein product [Fraxinus pennsylvanica]